MNSLIHQELQCVLMIRIIIVDGIRVIQYQFRWRLVTNCAIASPIRYRSGSG
nr:hypothetical protein [uncultured Flavobacterium sp.]